MTNFCINYVWLILAEKIIDKAKQFEKEREDCKNLSLLEIIKDKFDLHDFILNLKPDYLYLENLILDSLSQNSIPHQVFLKTYTADKLDYNKELGLNYLTNREAKEYFNSEILELFKENGKFQTKLNDFFKDVKKENNIKFIMIDEAQEEILSNLQKLLPDENERKKLKEDLEKMNNFYFELKEIVGYAKENFLKGNKEISIDGEKIKLVDLLNKNKEFLEKSFNDFNEFKEELKKETIKDNLFKLLICSVMQIQENYTKQNFILENLIVDFFINCFNNQVREKQILAQKAYLIDFSKFVSILYTNLIQEKNCLLTDFDTKKENLNSKIYKDENHVKFSFLSFLQTFIQLEKSNCSLPEKKNMLEDRIKQKDGIINEYGNFCHAGLFFISKSFINFSLFFVKNAFEFSEIPFLIPNEKTIQNNHIIYFAHNFEWTMDDFFDFFAQDYKNKDFEKQNYSEVENCFKSFIKRKYKFDKLIDKKNEGFNSSFLGEITLKSFENHFYSGFLEKMHIFNDNKNINMGFVQGKQGLSWQEQNFKCEIKNINEFLEKYKKKYEMVLNQVSQLNGLKII